MSLFGSSDADLNLTIKADTAAAQSSLGGLDTTFKKLTASFVAGNLITSAITKSFSFLEGVIGDSISAYEESENVLAQMNATLASTGHAAGMTGDQLVDLSKQLESMTTFSDEAVLSVENLLLTFTNITGDTFPKATAAVLDMSTALGEDASSAAIQLGKALNDPIQGVNALARVGVNFSDAQKEVIATMVKTGDTLGAQDLILKELTKEFGGSATAAAKTFQGQMKQLGNQIDDLEEEVGKGLTAGLYNLVAAMQDSVSGMGKNVDIGKIVFETFRNIEEIVLETGNVFVQFGTTVAGVGAGVADILTLGLNKQINDDMANLHKIADASSSFLQDVVDRNINTLSSWDAMTAASAALAKTAPAAYEATAQAAADAAQKITDANKAVSDTNDKISDLLATHSSSQTDTAKSEAEAYVAQAKKVQDLQAQFNDPTTTDRGAVFQQLQEEQLGLQKYTQYAVDHASDIAEANRRASETDFERQMEDLKAKQAADDADFTKQLGRDALELAANVAKRDALTAGEKTMTATVQTEAATRTAAVVASNDAQIDSYNKVVSAYTNATATMSINPTQSLAHPVMQSTLQSVAPAAFPNGPSPLIQFHFNGPVVGDDGIKNLINMGISQLNRSTTLKAFAGI